MPQQSTARQPNYEERREHERHAKRIEVGAQTGHQFFTGFTEDISAGGLFISTYETLPLGSILQVSFSVPGVDHTFETRAEVRWVREYDETNPVMHPGMGVRFLEIKGREEQFLNKLLTQMDTLFYEDDELAL